MNLTELQSLVGQNEEWFAGVHPETSESLLSAEQQLGCRLPASIKWLLSERGYSSACGVGSLDDAVEATLRLRRVLGLSVRYVIINDWEDAGVVYLDTADENRDGECPVYWAATHNINRLAEGKPLDSDVDKYEDYPAWVVNRLEDAKDEEVSV